ncbi:MAG: prophage antirepressor [Candidatus Berkelbacteria bacterium Licking1014_85]|uniref:Prophage antirepressor n=1 Tax=Candidatus Berkelbacteria bacterium Licking1014_85 TaxID=2017148 RepID=A0A554LLF0_9BACT|nr:MAG: prophage antirepressor [Candidatus Berkelbacteria bacterium Licking1014_85]
MPENTIAIFRGKQIRKTIYQNEWWFSVIDIVDALISSPNSGAYWRKLKQRLKEEGSEVVTFCHGLKLEAPDRKMRETDCGNTETIFRIIQSIPSPKAEPFFPIIPVPLVIPTSSVIPNLIGNPIQ